MIQEKVFSSFGLSHNPFSITAGTESYYNTGSTKQILDELTFGITSRSGFLALIGEVGVGKTALLHQLLHRLKNKDIECSLILNTMLNKEELLLAVLKDFGVKAPPSSANGAELVDLLQGFLIKQNKKEKNCVIIVDEAHNLSLDALECLRMLSNLETSEHKLVQILLIAQTELKERLAERKLRQLRSRINIYKELQAFTLCEAEQYINFKLAYAGSQLRISSAALDMIYLATEGNPRMINIIMERLLYAMFSVKSRDINVKVMKVAVMEVAKCQDEVARRLLQHSRRYKLKSSLAAAAFVAIFLLLPVIPTKAGFKSMVQVAASFFASEQITPEPFGDNTPANRQDTAGPQGSEADKSATVDAGSVQGEVAKGTAKSEKPLEKNSQAGSSIAVAEKNNLEPQADVSAVSEGLTQDKKSDILDKTAESLLEKSGYEEAYKQFLGPFGLEEKVGTMALAVEKKDIALLEEALPGGVQLLQLKRLPKAGSLSFTAFPWNKTIDEGPAWIVLYKPHYTVVDFFYGYRGQEIFTLQAQLKALGYYAGRLDGLVGPATWQAVNRFQEAKKIKRSMWPDRETIFWLSALSGVTK